ncbi:MAG: hypothetical protein E3K37_01470 [Candidatus Kuenenia sp.]|nr:hypothetical protein [Candidatus Kuenenia hertensis]
MPRIDFDKIGEIEDYSPVPEDSYVCELVEITEDETKNGDEMWKLKFEIAEGEYQGRYLFDNIVFSPEAAKRVKFICSRLGLKTSGNVELTPEMLLNRKTIINPITEDYIDENGKTKKHNKIPFAGYELYEGAPVGTATNSPFGTREKLPF